MCVTRLVAALSLLALIVPFVAVPVDAGSEAPSSWRLLFRFSDPAEGVHERTFTILPSQDYRHYTIRAYDPGLSAGGAAFQVNQAGLAEVNCRGAVFDAPVGGGVAWHCDDLRPNHSYRIIFSTTEPDVEVRLFGWD